MTTFSKMAFVDCGFRGCKSKAAPGCLYCVDHQASSSSAADTISANTVIINGDGCNITIYQQPPPDSPARIPLIGKNARGREALVDKADLDWILAKIDRWCAGGNGNNYVVGWLKDEKRHVRLHQLIMGGKDYDHVDRNPLNNQRYNLRKLDRSGQQRNQNPRGASRFPGVTRLGKKWQALIRDGEFFNRVRRNGKAYRERRQRYLGIFADELDAARAYRDAALKIDPLLRFDAWNEL